MPRSLALSLLFAGFAHAQIANIPIEHYTLPNGMEVIAHVDRRAPVVYLNFRFRVGSKHEKPGQTGLAHLFEHLLFQSRDAKGEFQSAAERIGATDVNAGTNQDFTEYYENVPTSRLERMLWMESNRFANLPQNLTQERLDQQRAVVINEKRQGRENVGYGMVPVLRVENLYPLGHPYQHEVLGSYPDLHAITLHDARTFYAEHYTPDQMTLALVGNFDPTRTKQWVTRYYGSLPPSNGTVSPPRSVPPLSAPKVIDVVDRVRVERVWFFWLAPPMAHRDEIALEFAGFLLTNGDRHLSRH